MQKTGAGNVSSGGFSRVARLAPHTCGSRSIRVRCSFHTRAAVSRHACGANKGRIPQRFPSEKGDFERCLDCKDFAISLNDSPLLIFVSFLGTSKAVGRKNAILRRAGMQSVRLSVLSF